MVTQNTNMKSLLHLHDHAVYTVKSLDKCEPGLTLYSDILKQIFEFFENLSQPIN